MVFLVLFLLPLLVMGAAWLAWREVTLKEAGIHAAVQAVVAGVSALLVYHSSVGDTEVWNGKVTGKKQVQVSCEHSYQCNCRQSCTGSGKDQTCSTTCDTCYEHFHDYDWEVYTTNSETIDIDRVDRQGEDTPPRWAQVEVGEPTTVPHSYTNYIKGAPDTLFRRQGLKEKYVGRLPEYPEVFDYYRMRRFIPVGVGGFSEGEWNEGLARLNADLGSAKQVNMLIVLTKEPQDWFHALEESWIGGKKNDVALVIGVDSENKATWASVMAWTNNDLFKVKLRDAVLDLGELTPEGVLPVLRENVFLYYERKPMKDFEYLKASITPSGWQWAISLFVGFAVSIGITVYLHKLRQRHRYNIHDPFSPRFSFRRF